MIPHPIQLIRIIRICDEILNGKGAIAQVKTGEGKSFIISVIAIILVLHGRKIDIITSNLELAIRD
jgi:preprotein translocase subunit SecA